MNSKWKPIDDETPRGVVVQLALAHENKLDVAHVYIGWWTGGRWCKRNGASYEASGFEVVGWQPTTEPPTGDELKRLRGGS